MARLMSLIENYSPDATLALKQLYAFTGQGLIVGITGPPGSGKSTLTDQLTQEFRRGNKSVGIVAVDPTSPFTGGAILADRIRMQQHSLDAGVFIRSMATRGHLGGLARATNDVVNVLDSAGKEIILVETVGVGQDEVEVVKTAHLSVVVTVPGLGDDIQAIKAGVLEIADIFVVNKADREGADKTVTELQAMLAAHLDREGFRQTRQRERSRALFLELFQERVTRRLLEQAIANGSLEETIERIADRDLDPYSAVEELLGKAGL
jgi:LAO/AO transport system kinase